MRHYKTQLRWVCPNNNMVVHIFHPHVYIHVIGQCDVVCVCVYVCERERESEREREREREMEGGRE